MENEPENGYFFDREHLEKILTNAYIRGRSDSSCHSYLEPMRILMFARECAKRLIEDLEDVASRYENGIKR